MNSGFIIKGVDTKIALNDIRFPTVREVCNKYKTESYKTEPIKEELSAEPKNYEPEVESEAYGIFDSITNTVTDVALEEKEIQLEILALNEEIEEEQVKHDEILISREKGIVKKNVRR